MDNNKRDETEQYYYDKFQREQWRREAETSKERKKNILGFLGILFIPLGIAIVFMSIIIIIGYDIEWIINNLF